MCNVFWSQVIEVSGIFDFKALSVHFEDAVLNRPALLPALPLEVCCG